MSFFGKQYKKVKAENALEFIGRLNLSMDTVALIRNPDTISSFLKNADGTLQYIIKTGSGTTILNHNIVLGDHAGFTSPDGMDTKVKFALSGDVLKSHMHLPDHNVVHMDRYFEDNTMRMEIYMKNDEKTATIYYEAI